MMNSAKVEHIVFERQIDVYENERLWIGRGWSKEGLLLTERGPFSTKDGSLSWKTITEASLALLRGEVVAGSGNGIVQKTIRRGWSFHEEDCKATNLDGSNKENKRKEDEYECSTEHGDDSGYKYCGFVPCRGPEDGPTDEEGWQYFPDFLPQSLVNPNPNGRRGMLDFVRRRKLRRVAVFRPDHFLPNEIYSKCDFCDSSVVNMLSSAMLDALSLAVLFAHGPKNKVTDAQALPLKSKLVDSLSIGYNCSNDAQSEDHDPWIDVNKVKDILCAFAETCVGKPGALVHLINPDVDQNLVYAMPDMQKTMSIYFTDAERLHLARLLVKDVDRYSYKMHCRVDSCACVASNGVNAQDAGEKKSSCEFRLISCPNENCMAVFSFKHRVEHDDECGHKILDCPSGCGAKIPRNEVHIHVRDKCNLRQAECPLSILGCTAIVQAQDVTPHLNEHADKHFILVVNRMMEYQTVIKDLNSRLCLLEEKNGQLERELKRATAQLQSKNEAKAVSNDVKKLTKRIGTLESTCKTEFKKVEYDRRNHRK